MAEVPKALQTKTDPRLYQMTILSGLLIYGMAKLDFDVTISRVLTYVFTGLVTQWVCGKIVKLPRFDPLSPMTSALSLSLLLRTEQPLLAVFAMLITIASKFLFRWQGKHIFNPTNFGIVVMLCLSDAVWVSAGQWGATALFGFFIACLGGVVIHRSARSDVSYAFLAFYCALLVSRSIWLGEPMSIPLHQLQNGAVLLFSFFMISDPKTTPNTRSGRIVFALLVALGAVFVQFVLYQPNGLLWSLVSCAMMTPLIDRVFPGGSYRWSQTGPLFQATNRRSSYSERSQTERSFS